MSLTKLRAEISTRSDFLHLRSDFRKKMSSTANCAHFAHCFNVSSRWRLFPGKSNECTGVGLINFSRFFFTNPSAGTA